MLTTPMNLRKVAFRLDASPTIGYGHLARCSALMEVFVEKGWQVSVLTRDPERAEMFLAERDLKRVSTRRVTSADVEQEAFEIRQLVAEEQLVCLVVDHYEYTENHLRLLKTSDSILVCVDDGLKESYPVDIFVNPNLGALDAAVRVLSATQCLLGPEFLLIRKIFKELRKHTSHQTQSRCFLCFGGSDPRNATAQVLQLLDATTSSPLNVDVVLGPGFHGQLATSELANLKVLVHRDPEDLALLMKCSDFAIVPPSSIFWELACLGVPALTITTALNHQHVGEKVGAAGLSCYLGTLESLTPESFKSGMVKMQSMRSDSRLVDRLRSAVDGEGASRVLDAVEGRLLSIRK